MCSGNRGEKSGLNKAYTEYLSNTKEIKVILKMRIGAFVRSQIFVEACMSREVGIRSLAFFRCRDDKSGLL